MIGFHMVYVSKIAKSSYAFTLVMSSHYNLTIIIIRAWKINVA